MKPPGDIVPRIISGVPEATIDKSKREFLRASAALLVGLNLPKLPSPVAVNTEWAGPDSAW